jgi:hypothetical protein
VEGRCGLIRHWTKRDIELGQGEEEGSVRRRCRGHSPTREADRALRAFDIDHRGPSVILAQFGTDRHVQCFRAETRENGRRFEEGERGVVYLRLLAIREGLDNGAGIESSRASTSCLSHRPTPGAFSAN